MVSKLSIPGAFDYHHRNYKMESRVENRERSLLEGRKVNGTRLEEIKRLWERRKGDCSRRRSRRGHAPSRRADRRGAEFKWQTEKELDEEKRDRRHQRTSSGHDSVYELLDRALLLVERNYAFWGGGPAVEDEESKLEMDSGSLQVQGSSNHQQWGIAPISQIPFEIAEEMKDEEEKLLDVQVKEIEVEDDGGAVFNISEMKTDVSNIFEMKREREEDRHQGGGGSRSENGRCVGGIGSDISKGDDGRYEGGGRGSWVETTIGGGRVRPPEPSELPYRDVSMEKGGSSPTFRLPPPEPTDLVMYKETGGSLVTAEGGSSPGVDELSTSAPTESPEPPDPWPCAAALGTIAAPEHKDMAAARSIVKRKHKEGGAEMELQKLGHFLNLMGQAQISLINWGYDKEGLRSSLKQQIGPVLEATQITDEQKMLQEERGMGLGACGPNPISQIELKTQDGVSPLTSKSEFSSENSPKLGEADLMGSWENSAVFSFVLSVFGDAKAFMVHDQKHVKFILLGKSTKIHIATVIEVELHNAKPSFEETHFNLLSALNNIEAKKRFELLEAVSGYKLLHQVEPLSGEVLDYVQQSRGSYNEEQISLYARMEEYKIQIFEEGRLSLNDPYGSPSGATAHPFYKIANEGIDVVMESAANGKVQIVQQGYPPPEPSSNLRGDRKRRYFVFNSQGVLYFNRKPWNESHGSSQPSAHRNSVTKNGSGLLSQWLSPGITAAAQDTEIDLDFFLFDPGGTYAEFEGGCAAIVNSGPIIMDPTPLVAEVNYTIGVGVNFQNNFLKSQISATNFQDNACGFLLVHRVCIPPNCDEIGEIIVACCKHYGAELSSTKMGLRRHGSQLSGFKQWDPGKVCSRSHSLVHLEDKVNFEGEGIDADMRRPRRL